jgi:hypothetical protein
VKNPGTMVAALLSFAQARKLLVGPGATYAMPMNAAASGVARSALGALDIGAFEYGKSSAIFSVSRGWRTRSAHASRAFDLRGRKL